MEPMKIEWVDKHRLSLLEPGVAEQEMLDIGCLPVVRLEQHQAALAAKEAELEAVKATALDDRVKAKQELARVKEHLQEIVWERDDLLGQRDDLLSHVGKLKQQLDTLLAEAVWAMEILTACERLRRLPLPGDIYNAQAFLARPDVHARQKETP